MRNKSKGRLKIFRRPLFIPLSIQNQPTSFNAIYELIPTAPLLSISPFLPTTVNIMLTYTRSVWLDAPLEAIFRYCTSRHGFTRQFPFDVQWLSEKEYWERGDILDFKYRVCGIWLRHRAEIISLEPNQSFTDLMLQGIYRSFRHTHEFKSSGGRTCVTDTVKFTIGLGKMIDRLIGLPTLRRTFEKRHRLLKERTGYTENAAH
jgi:putative cell division inhibitor SULA